MAQDSALVLVSPEDTVDSVIQKVRDAGASSVELLVIEGAPALQKIGDVSKLRRSADARNIQLLLITSDAPTLNAARLSKVEAVSVQGTQVNPAKPATTPAADDNPYATAVLPAVEPTPATQSDEDFLSSLDAFAAPPTLPSNASGAPASQSDDDILAALDSIDNPYAPTRGSSADDDFAADLDSLGDYSSGAATQPIDAQPRRRVRPEDIELTDEERERAATRGRRPTPSRVAPAPSRERTRRSRTDEDEDAFAPQVQPRRRNPLLAIIPVVVILLILAIGAYLFFRNRTTVTVTPPRATTTDQSFDDLVLPLNKAGTPTDSNSPAVQAIDISAEAVFTATGTVASETTAPNNSAKGVVTLFNQSAAPVSLPQGTEFLGSNGQGQEVRFTSDADVSVPGATTARQGAQIITNLGQVQVALTARAPGSASNIAANTITQIAIPGQQPVALNGTLSIDQGPITGGDEQQVRVVTDGDVQNVLAQALTGLYDGGRKSLQAQADTAQRGWKLEDTTVIPSTEDLGRQGEGQAYDLAVNPPVGSNVDPASPGFNVIVRATFKGLATPADRSLPKQLETALPLQLANEGKLTAGLEPTINSWHWDGSRLTASGVLKPNGTQPTLDARTRTAIIESIQGKSHADAQAALEDFKRQGVISDYTLPDVDTLPSLNFQLDLRVVQ